MILRALGGVLSREMASSAVNIPTVSHSDKMEIVLHTDLSLRCDPDGQSAVVPPLIHKQTLIVRPLLTAGGVEPHVVDHAVILDVAACGGESLSVEKLALIIHSVTHSH